ncbi:hypothetical protein V2A60_005495 [Cordyceps javanica]|uniref:Uncharacterized protein n=1 Tax=Cordyceps javanica TaxID=43265 RepID=A0A545VX67_9HYPO|nr:hypothetical protein IF1G_06463 [Cordyceps javanica]TQW06319.1 EB module domain-containing protein [Cordyceps javanica]
MSPQLITVITALLALAAASPAPGLLNLEKRCIAVEQYCGNGGQCCPGSACSYTSSRCTAYGNEGANCGNAVPCAAGLGCSYKTNRCTPYHTAGQQCNDGVQCVAGLNCNWKGVCA